MRNKITLVAAGCLILLAMLVVSCAGPTGPATTASPTSATKDTTKTGATTKETPKSGATTKETPKPGASAGEAPKYGGILNVHMTTSPNSFDQGLGLTSFQVPTMYLTNEELLRGDWAKGGAGTGEYSFTYAGDLGYDNKVPYLAESWKIVEPGVMEFKIRKGVHFALNPDSEASKMVNGREVTVEDWVYSLNRIMENSRYIRASAKTLVENTKVTAVDANTLRLTFPPEETLFVMSYLVVNGTVIPKEVVDKYGDMEDWRNSVGTGPFMLTDYVSGSSVTFTKNPNYWQTDPVGPGKGNKLPYVDGVKALILPDPSTRLTAIRTGKIDYMGGVPALVKEDYDSLMDTTPKLKSARNLANGNNMMYMRTDKKDLPFANQKVRQALTMAIDFKSITDKLMLGDAESPGFPTHKAPDFKGIYFPLSEAPQIVQEMFSYKPDKAKQLLAEAGYPDGFKTKVIVDGTGGVYVDEVSIIKEYWSKIGVDLEIEPMEAAAFSKERSARSHEEMMYTSSGSYWIYIRMVNWDMGSWGNSSYVDDPVAKKAKSEMLQAMIKGDQATADKVYKEFEKYGMEQAYMIPMPRPYNYVVWWPWLKNYHGEGSLSFSGSFTWAHYVWLDQDMKKSMGY